jgi:hypothetical protein
MSATIHARPTLNIKPLSASWEDVYHANLLQTFLHPEQELINHTFELGRFGPREILNPARGFRKEFSEAMAEWVINGGIDVTDRMKELNPNAAKFGTFFDNGDMQLITAYGPRIQFQTAHVLRELIRDPNSRRACIMMLGEHDQHVARALADGETNCEYLCTYAFNFRIREGAVDMHVSMRSNNYTTTVCQDVFVFDRLQQYIAAELSMPAGKYYHHTVSGHILPGEVERATEILRAYIQASANEHGPVVWTAENGWFAGVRQFTQVCYERGLA